MPKGLSAHSEYNKLNADQRELHLMVKNTGDIRHENQYNSIDKNYKRKIKSGKYDFDLSIKGYKNLVSNVRRDPKIKKLYEGSQSQYFKPSDDNKVSRVMALEFYEENEPEIKKMKRSQSGNSSKTNNTLAKLERKGYL